MKHSAGVILFREKKGKREYLLLQYEADYWGFCKGEIEKNESEEETALREVREETSLKKIRLIPKFKEKTSYFFTIERKKVYKEVVWFLGKVLDKNDGKVSWEHSALIWLPYDEAISKIKFKKDLLVVEKAEKFLASQYQQ